MKNQPTPPLAGLKILDLSTLIAAPMASTLLADFGAEVVKVELPQSGDALRELAPRKNGEPLWWKVTNRNKKGITLDIRTPEGCALLKRLLPTVDVLVENFRPGTLERYGLDCETLHEINPHLIILRVSGYGQTGPFAKRPGFARIAEAFSGFTFLCGDPERSPMHTGFPIADAITGLFGAMSILIACHRRANAPDAMGEIIDLSLFESMFRLLEFLPIEYDQLNAVRERSGNRSQYAAPSNLYLSRDGKWISLSASSQSVFERLSQAIGRPDLITDPRYETNTDRVKNAKSLDAIIGKWLSERDMNEALAVLEMNQVSCGPVNSIQDIFESEHYRAREAIVYPVDKMLGPVAMPNVVPKMTNAPGQVLSVGPDHGQDTDAFFSEMLQLSIDEIEALRRKKVI